MAGWFGGGAVKTGPGVTAAQLQELVPKPVEMPQLNNQQGLQQQMALQAARAGRASTILTGPGATQTSGAAANYGNTYLGQ